MEFVRFRFGVPIPLCYVNHVTRSTENPAIWVFLASVSRNNCQKNRNLENRNLNRNLESEPRIFLFLFAFISQVPIL